MAAMVVKGARIHLQKELYYDKKSVDWVDAKYIDFLAEKYHDDHDFMNRLVEIIGSFLGECIIINHGGLWQQEEGMGVIVFDDGSITRPFSKVHKRFLNGTADSLSWYYEITLQIHKS